MSYVLLVISKSSYSVRTRTHCCSVLHDARKAVRHVDPRTDEDSTRWLWYPYVPKNGESSEA